jgi:hypothetical protein
VSEPQAFDPSQPFSVLSAQKVPAVADVPRDARGMPAVSSNTSDAGSSPLMEMLGPLAHPQTFTDFARLLTLPVDSVKKAIAGALTMHAARNATAATGQAVKGAGDIALSGAAKVGDVVDPDVIGAISPRAGKVVELAQKVRDARAAAAAKVAQAAPAAEAAPSVAPEAVAAPPVRPAAVAAPESVPGGTPPPAGPPLSPAPAGSPAGAVPPATPEFYPQKFLNEVAIQARRRGMTLTDADYAAARALTQQGKTAAEAVAEAVAEIAPAEASAASVVPKPRLTSQEASAYMKLRAAGKTDAEAKAAVEASRAFQEQFGLKVPTAEETRFPKGLRGKLPPR